MSAPAVTPLFSLVVVGVDDDRADAGGAATLAFARALAPAARLILVSAFSYEGDPSSSPDGYPDEMRVAALAGLAEARAEAGEPSAELVAIGSGSPGAALRRLAAERGADLIVVATTGAGPVGRVLLGDVARAALHGSHCAVAVVPQAGAAARIRRIGVAFDRSPEARAALELGARLAHTQGAALEIVDAIDDPRPGTGSQAALSGEDLRRGVEQSLRALAMDLPVPTTVHARLGRTAVVLAELASRMDLVICGSRGRGPLARVMLGSTSDALIHSAACPVLVVPHGAHEPAADQPPESYPALASTAAARLASELRSS